MALVLEGEHTEYFPCNQRHHYCSTWEIPTSHHFHRYWISRSCHRNYSLYNLDSWRKPLLEVVTHHRLDTALEEQPFFQKPGNSTSVVWDETFRWTLEEADRTDPEL